MIGSGFELKNTKKGGWKGKQGQNVVVLAFFLYKKKRTGSKATSFWPDPFKIKNGQNDVVLDP